RNTRTLVLDLDGDAEDGGNGSKGRAHDLVVEDLHGEGGDRLNFSYFSSLKFQVSHIFPLLSLMSTFGRYSIMWRSVSRPF
ncbi:hypothetical protein U1Q18_000784, partial [Sarracenia purpurea var. burkii]